MNLGSVNIHQVAAIPNSGSDSSHDRLAPKVVAEDPSCQVQLVKHFYLIKSDVGSKLPPRKPSRGIDVPADPVHSTNAVRRLRSTQSSPAKLNGCVRISSRPEPAEGTGFVAAPSNSQEEETMETNYSTRSLLKAVTRGMQRAFGEQGDDPGQATNTKCSHRRESLETSASSFAYDMDEPPPSLTENSSDGVVLSNSCRWSTSSVSSPGPPQLKRAMTDIPRSTSTLGLVNDVKKDKRGSWGSTGMDRPIVCPQRQKSQALHLGAMDMEEE